MKLLFAKPRNGWINVNSSKLVHHRNLEEFLLYALFMFWVVASISVVVAGMLLGGLLCLWCAFISRRRLRSDMATLSLYSASSPPMTTRPITIVQPKNSSTSSLTHTRAPAAYQP
jgi:hypothetical protein